MTMTIKATYRSSFKMHTKIGDVYETFEYGEERTIDPSSKEEYEAEKTNLWDKVEAEVSNRIRERLTENGTK